VIKVLFVVHKRSDLGTEEFRRYWKEKHGPIAAKMPGLRKYVQNHVVLDPSQDEPAYDGIAELHFDSVEAFQAALASPEGQATFADVQNFVEPNKLYAGVVEEVAII
jgi:uncharacterized protein (TIGR02118 family)